MAIRSWIYHFFFPGGLSEFVWISPGATPKIPSIPKVPPGISQRSFWYFHQNSDQNFLGPCEISSKSSLRILEMGPFVQETCFGHFGRYNSIHFKGIDLRSCTQTLFLKNYPQFIQEFLGFSLDVCEIFEKSSSRSFLKLSWIFSWDFASSSSWDFSRRLSEFPLKFPFYFLPGGILRHFVWVVAAFLKLPSEYPLEISTIGFPRVPRKIWLEFLPAFLWEFRWLFLEEFCENSWKIPYINTGIDYMRSFQTDCRNNFRKE